MEGAARGRPEGSASSWLSRVSRILVSGGGGNDWSGLAEQGWDGALVRHWQVKREEGTERALGSSDGARRYTSMASAARTCNGMRVRPGERRCDAGTGHRRGGGRLGMRWAVSYLCSVPSRQARAPRSLQGLKLLVR